MLKKFAFYIHADYNEVLFISMIVTTMLGFKEGLSNFVNKIKSMLGRKKVVEEKSADLFGALTAPVADPGYTEAGYPYIDNKDIGGEPKVIPMDANHQDKEPTAMAA